MGVGGGDSDITVDIVLQRFEMKGEKKKEDLSSWHQTQWEGDGNCSNERVKGHGDMDQMREGHVARGGQYDGMGKVASHVRL